MAAQQLQNFNNNFVAFYRPQKREYCLLTWSPATRHWWKAELDEHDTPLTLHRSTVHPPATGHINVKSRIAIRIDFTAQGFFVKTTNTQTNQVSTIPILSLTPQAYRNIPASMKKKSYFATQPAAEYEQAQALWTVAPAPQANQQPAPRPLAPQPASVQVEAIPKRIAWLIAAEAEKQEENCPITMDTISPLTAAVTTCFHCFDAEALAAWNVTRGGGATECPLCKKKCLFTKAFDE
jgi:hypothetical protein